MTVYAVFLLYVGRFQLRNEPNLCLGCFKSTLFVGSHFTGRISIKSSIHRFKRELQSFSTKTCFSILYTVTLDRLSVVSPLGPSWCHTYMFVEVTNENNKHSDELCSCTRAMFSNIYRFSATWETSSSSSSTSPSFSSSPSPVSGATAKAGSYLFSFLQQSCIISFVISVRLQ